MLAPDELKLMHSALRRTWDVIGGDVLASGDGKDMDRSAVIECVLDANYLENYGIRKDVTKDLIKKFRDFGYDMQQEIAKEAFPHQRYGY